MSKTWPLYALTALIGLIAVYSGFTGKKMWFITDTRTAVITLTAIGFIMCSLGQLAPFVTKATAHPLSILGYLLGTTALVIGVAQVFRFRLPVLHDPTAALTAICIVIVLKFIIARFHFIL